MHIGHVLKLLVLFLIVPLGACAHLPPAPTAGCALPSYRLLVSKDGLGSGVRSGDDTDVEEFRSMVSRALRDAHRVRATSDDVLILSGGSQHGAFGAGFFAGMGQAPGRVPDYTFVTGVSTGALVSTLVFLANEPVASGRTYPPYMTGTGVSNLEDLAAIFSVDKEDRIIRPYKGGILQGAMKGSLATFAPLRQVIFGMLSDPTLTDLQEAHQAGRHLLVGVTNLENGDGYAIDLTKYVDDALGGGVAKDTIRHCYIDALLASSSVPPGMPPVTLVLSRASTPQLIDKPSLYIDGGARFGVFWGQTDKTLPELRNATVLINGTFSAGSWEDYERKGKWSILNVAKRSVGILVNQVYRFSVDQVEQQFPPPLTLKQAFISNYKLAERYGPAKAMEPGDFVFKKGNVEKTCSEWADYDDEHFHPLEFQADYMQCLVAYGRMRGSSAPWNRETP